MVIPVIIPVLKGRPVYPKTIESIKNQSVDTKIIEVQNDFYTMEEYKDYPELTKKYTREKEYEKYRSLALGMNNCVQAAKKLDDPFIVFCDCDLELIYPDNFSLMMKALNEDASLGAVCLKGLDIPVVCVDITMFRHSSLQYANYTIPFDWRDMTQNICSCKSLVQSLSDHGLKIDYLDNTIRFNSL